MSGTLLRQHAACGSDAGREPQLLGPFRQHERLAYAPFRIHCEDKAPVVLFRGLPCTQVFAEVGGFRPAIR